MINILFHYISGLFTRGGTVFALWFTIFKQLFTKYIFNDWDFVGFLFVLILMDTFFGCWKVILKGGWGALSFIAAERFFVKVFLYFGVLVLSHVLGAFTIHGKPNIFFSWIDAVLYGYMIAKESLSVARNINAIKPAYVPKFILDRLEKFQQSGKIKDLTEDEETK